MKSKIVLTLIVISGLASLHHFARWDLIVGGGDAWGYYGYLPAIFIHQDLGTLKKSLDTRYLYHSGDFDTSFNNPINIDEAKHLGDGKQVMKYPIGIAICYLPLFLIAHFLALLLGVPADGYAPIYMKFVNHASWFYVSLGMILLWKYLKNYFSDGITALGLFVIFFGTNLCYFTSYYTGFSHGFIFGLAAALLYVTHLHYQRQRTWTALLIGLLLGWIVICRPTDIILAIVPALYGGGAFFTKKYSHKNWLIPLAALLAGSLQLFYWKWATGSWIHYSYHGESFDFYNPKIIDGLFSLKNGWLAYTPLMALSLLGVFMVSKKNPLKHILFLLVPIHIYITYSWWCWNYIGGYGSRPMVDIFPILTVPLCYFYYYAFKNKIIKYLTLLVTLFLVFINIVNIIQIKNSVLFSEDSHLKYHLAMLGKTKATYNDLVLLDTKIKQPNPSTIQVIDTIFYEKFSPNSYKVIKGDSMSYYGLTLENTLEYSTALVDTLASTSTQDEWLKISIKVLQTINNKNYYKNAVLVVELNNQWYGLKLDNKIGVTDYSIYSGAINQWDILDFYLPLPKGEQIPFKTYVWNQTIHEVWIDYMSVEKCIKL